MKLRQVWDTDNKRKVYILDQFNKPHQLWTDGEDFYVYDRSRWIKINNIMELEPAEYGANYRYVDNEMIGYYDSCKSTDMFVFESWDQVYYEFKNGESVLDKGDIDEGETPVYAGETPTKAATAQYTYTFSWWEPEVGPITHRTIYQAQFTSTVNKYTISIAANDADLGSVSESSISNVPYWTKISIDEESGNLIIGEGETATTVIGTPVVWYGLVNWTDDQWEALPATLTGALSIVAVFEQVI